MWWAAGTLRDRGRYADPVVLHCAKVREMAEEGTSCCFHTAVVLWRKCTECVSASSACCSLYNNAVQKNTALIGKTEPPLIVSSISFLLNLVFGMTAAPPAFPTSPTPSMQIAKQMDGCHVNSWNGWN